MSKTEMDDSLLSLLTPREHAVLDHVSRGYRSKEIGPMLGISHYRVDELCASACAKLKVSRRIEAGRLYRLAMGQPPEPLGGQPIGVYPPTLSPHSEDAVREPRALFVVDDLDQLPATSRSVVDEQEPRLSPVHTAMLLVVTIAALALIGIALAPLAASVQTMANAFDPPKQH